jgi:hypothetical protein
MRPNKWSTLQTEGITRGRYISFLNFICNRPGGLRSDDSNSVFSQWLEQCLTYGWLLNSWWITTITITKVRATAYSSLPEEDPVHFSAVWNSVKHSSLPTTPSSMLWPALPLSQLVRLPPLLTAHTRGTSRDHCTDSTWPLPLPDCSFMWALSFSFFETQSHYVPQAGLEFPSSCLCFLDAGITSVNHKALGILCS